MTDKEVKTENFEHCIEAQSLCLGFTSSNVPHLSVAKTIAQEAPRFLLFYQKSDRAPNYVQVLFLALAFNFFLKRPDIYCFPCFEERYFFADVLPMQIG